MATTTSTVSPLPQSSSPEAALACFDGLTPAVMLTPTPCLGRGSSLPATPATALHLQGGQGLEQQQGGFFAAGSPLAPSAPLKQQAKKPVARALFGPVDPKELASFRAQVSERVSASAGEREWT